MDPEFVAFKLEEVATGLRSIAEALRSGASLDLLDGELRTEFELAVRRLNRIWNTRQMEQGEYDLMSQEQFEAWSEFPIDLLS